MYETSACAIYASFSCAVVPDLVQCSIVLCPLYESFLAASTPDRKFKQSWPPQIYQETSDIHVLHGFTPVLSWRLRVLTVTIVTSRFPYISPWIDVNRLASLIPKNVSCYTFCWNCMGLAPFLPPPPPPPSPRRRKVDLFEILSWRGSIPSWKGYLYAP